MKLLLDQNLSFKLCRKVAHLFPASEHVRGVGLANADDREIWNYAAVHDFTILSLDSDFAEMAALRGPPPKVIWLRCGNRPTALLEKLLLAQQGAIGAFQHNDAACLEIYYHSDERR